MKDKQMKTNPVPTILYVGRREAVIREFGGLAHIYPGKYLAQLDGPASWDADGCSTLKDLRALIAEYKTIYPGIQIGWF